MMNWKACVGGLVGGLFLLTGCVTEVETPQSEGAEEAPATKPATGQHPKAHFNPMAGPGAMMLVTALNDLELTAGQRSTLEGLADDANGKVDFSTHKELMVVLAQGLRAGAIDDDAVNEKLTAIGNQRAEHEAEGVASFNTLHATLLPKQRVALVEIVRERGEQMRKHFEGKANKHGGHGAENGGPKKGGPRAHGGEMWFARELKMTEAQREELKTALGDEGMKRPSREEMAEGFAKMKQNMDAMLTAFATDTFDAKTYVVAAHGEMADKGMAHYVETVKALSVILDEEQRNVLAGRIEAGPKMGHHNKHHAPDEGEPDADADAESEVEAE